MIIKFQDLNENLKVLCNAGCVACPFSQNIQYELNILKTYEHNKHTAMMKLLGNAYQYKK